MAKEAKMMEKEFTSHQCNYRVVQFMMETGCIK